MFNFKQRHYRIMDASVPVIPHASNTSGNVAMPLKVSKKLTKKTGSVTNKFIDDFLSKHKSIEDHHPKKGVQARMKDVLQQVMDKNMSFKPYAHPGWVILAACAGLINAIAAISQIVIIVNRESAADLSWIFLGGAATVHVLWMLYSFGNQLWIGFTSSLLAILFLIILMSLKFKYHKEAVESEEP